MIGLIKNQQTPVASEHVDHVLDKQLIEDCLTFVKSLEDCAGMSANQLIKDNYRINKRFFFGMNDPSKREFLIFLNPVIHEYLGKTAITIEGCLTYDGDKEDGKRIYVRRYHSVKVSYQDMSGETFVGVISGFSAQVFQHCTDHLNGVDHKFTDENPVKEQGRNDICSCGSGRKYKHCCIIKRSV